MELFTTLAEIKNQNRHEHNKRILSRLIKNLGSDWPDDKEISLMQILENNGAADCVWMFRLFGEVGKRLSIEFIFTYIKQILPGIEKKYPLKAQDFAEPHMKTIKKWLANPWEVEIDELKNAVRLLAACAWFGGVGVYYCVEPTFFHDSAVAVTLSPISIFDCHKPRYKERIWQAKKLKEFLT